MRTSVPEYHTNDVILILVLRDLVFLKSIVTETIDECAELGREWIMHEMCSTG